MLLGSPRSPRVVGGVVRRAPRVVALLLLAAATACSGGEEEAATPEATPTVEPMSTTLNTGEVAGKLGAPRVEEAVGQVGEVVDGWLDAAFAGGEWPREVTDAYGGFTARAAEKAAADGELTSAAGFSQQVEAVEVTRRVVAVDLAAPGGKLAGATARVKLDLETTGEVERTVRVRGRLFLTPGADGWKIFGYNLTQGDQ